MTVDVSFVFLFMTFGRQLLASLIWFTASLAVGRPNRDTKSFFGIYFYHSTDTNTSAHGQEFVKVCVVCARTRVYEYMFSTTIHFCPMCLP